jgi:hypothetical protein
MFEVLKRHFQYTRNKKNLNVNDQYEVEISIDSENFDIQYKEGKASVCLFVSMCDDEFELFVNSMNSLLAERKEQKEKQKKATEEFNNRRRNK